MCTACSLEIIPEDTGTGGWGGRAGGGRKAEPELKDPKVTKLPLLFGLCFCQMLALFFCFFFFSAFHRLSGFDKGGKMNSLDTKYST